MLHSIRILSCTLVALALASTAEAQPGPVRRALTPVSPDTVTSDQIVDVNGRTTLRATGRPFTGIVADRWPSGQFKLLRGVEDGKATGLWTEWYASGATRYLAEWHPEGQGEGAWFYFHESGLVSERTVYRRDIPFGPSEGWHANGQKAFDGAYDDQGRRIGPWRRWAADGRLEHEVTYDDGAASSVAATWRPEASAPCRTPCLFAPGVISTDAEEFRLVFSPDGREAFLTRRPPGGVQRIYHTRFENGRWTQPQPAPFSTNVEEELALSADGQRVVFASRRPMLDRLRDRSDNLWTSARTPTGWSTPRPLPRTINRARPADAGWPLASEFAGALLLDGNLLFWTAMQTAGDADLFLAPAVGASFGAPMPLGPSINTSAFESAPAVSPDGRFLVFQRSGAPDGAGQEDLYIAEREGNGWGAARRLDGGVSTRHNESFPSFTPDGSSLVFSSDRGGSWSVYVVAMASLTGGGMR